MHFWGCLNSWVVSHLALINGTLRHALGCEFKPQWWQTLFQTPAQHLRFIHDSIWFDYIICLSNLSCELWNRKLKIKETFFKKRKKYYLKALKRLATVLERNNVGMGQDLNCVLLRKGSNVFTNCYTAFYWLTLIVLQSQERKPYYYSAWSKLSFSLLYSQTVWRDWVIFLSSWHQIFL